MKLEFKHLLPDNFAPGSRVWVYQSSRMFMLSEALEIEALLNNFSSEWRSHGAEVNAFCNLFFGQFLIFIADETNTSVSGCSTDSSVRFVKQLGEQYKVDFFDRTTLAFVVKDKIQLLPLSQLQYAADHHFIDSETLFFNNVVQTKEQLENNWIIPVKNSWLNKRISLPAVRE